jgi:MSHA biogenesis protein MshM
VLMALGMAVGAALYASLGHFKQPVASQPAANTPATPAPAAITPAQEAIPRNDDKKSIKTMGYKSPSTAPAAAPSAAASTEASLAPTPVVTAPLPSASPPSNTDALLEARLAATTAWLAGAKPRTYTIQLLGSTDDQQLNQHLKTISNSIEINSLFVYRTVAKGAPSLTVVWGSFDSQREAPDAMAKLPPFLKASQPLLRTVQGIKAELRQKAS